MFGVDSKRFVSAGRDRAAKLIDAKTGAFLENVNLLRGELSAIARHPKKDIVVIGGEERYPYIYLMDRPRNMKIADDTTLVRKLERQDGAIAALDWSPDGSRIAVAGLSPDVNLYDPGNRRAKVDVQGSHRRNLCRHVLTRWHTAGDGWVRRQGSNLQRCGLHALQSFIPVPLTRRRCSNGRCPVKLIRLWYSRSQS